MAKRSPYMPTREFVEYKGIRVEIKLDRTNKCFVAEYAGSILSAEKMTDLERAIRQAIADSLDLTWTPVIQVESLEPFATSSNSFIGFRQKRFYIAQFPDGRYMKADWGTPHGDFLSFCDSFYWNEKKHGPFTPPLVLGSAEKPEYWHLYTDQMWEQLDLLQQQIRQTKAGLHQVLAQPELLLHLSFGTQLLLPEEGKKGSEE